MIIARIEGATRVCGRDQGYSGLPIRDVIVDIEGVGEMPFMLSAWEPTPQEQAKIAAGAKLIVWIAGSTPPPMMVEVGAAPDAAQDGIAA